MKINPMRKIFYTSVIILVLFSCKKTTDVKPGPPTIEYVNFTTSDSYTAKLTFSFSDPDGDIGIQQDLQDSSNYDFFMRYYYKNHNGDYVPFYYHAPNTTADPYRDSTIYTYHLPYIVNTITTHTLNGQVEVDLSGYKPGNLDSLNNFKYKIWIYDRAGNKSNVITTPEFHTNY